MSPEEQRTFSARMDYITGRLLCEVAMHAAQGREVSILREAKTDEQTRAFLVLLSGDIPPECVRDFQELLARWGQDVHMGCRLLEKRGG